VTEWASVGGQDASYQTKRRKLWLLS